MRSSLHGTSLSLLGLAALLLTGCPDDDGTGGAGGSGGAGGAGGAGGGPPSGPEWQSIFDEEALDRTLLSVWGTSASNLFVVGGPLGNAGFEALALRYDGDAWEDLAPGGSDTFWWVHGTRENDVWMVGEQGRITHFDGTKLEEHEPVTTATLWGAIAFAPDDVWAVGGMVGGPATSPDDVVLHYDGSTWTQIPLPGEPKQRALFKVWGTSSDNLVVVGEAGVIWHKNGDEWIAPPPIANGILTTVHGCSENDVYAVGGRDVLHFDGTTWTRLDLVLSNDVNGVFCGSDGDVALVGMGGLKQRRVDGAWQDDFTKDPHGNLHAVWGDETGAYWAVGGDFVAGPKPNIARNGIVARYGTGTISSVIE